MMRLKATALAVAMLTTASGLAMAEEKLDIVFAVHSSASNTFWQAAKKGYDDACAKVSANCQMLFTQTEGSVPEQLANLEAALAQKPAAILTSIVDNNALDDVIQRARDAGIVVIGVNVDDLEGAKGNARQAFVCQGFLAAGHSLGQAQAANFPAEGPIKVLVGISAPGQNWSEQRGQGVISFLEEYKASSGRDVSWEKIDSGTDLAITSDRVGAYLAAHPDTTAYFDTGFWHAGVARVLADRGEAPGKVLLGGFDLVPEAVEQMQKGYIQVEVDQQPYMQGFMPVMMVYLAKNFGLAPANVDTGQGIVKAADAAALMELAAKGLR
ncbi:MAG: sugar ABC transporter substrate-binding protein [Rhizobiales bacterium]|nr:sugar ABC transporter substrate-binding protein [Hyphomicrobiales bacterium]